MDYFEQRFRQLVSQLLDGDLASHEEAELLRLCEAKPERIPELQSELELAELIRQASKDEASAAGTLVRPIEAIIGPAPKDDFDELMQRLLSGEASDSDFEQLARHGWRSPEARRELFRSLRQDDLLHQSASKARSAEAFVEALATRMWAEQEEDAFVEGVASQIIQLHPEVPTVIEEEAQGRPVASPVSYFGGWAAAAAAAILLTAALLFQPGGDGPVSTVAEIARVDGEVKWAESSEQPVFTTDTEEGRHCLVPGRYTLESGVVSLVFLSGAEMTVEGPADFEIIGEQEAFVHSGLAILAKNSAEPTNRFRLQTDALDLGDQGETIGLIADGSNAAEAVIFDGDGRVCLPENAACREMFALEPIRADPARGKLFDIPYNPAVFAKAWQAMSGVVASMGPVNLVVPGSEDQGQPNNEVQVIVEKSHFVSQGEIEVDTLDPGQLGNGTDGAGRMLKPEDREFRSYLVRLRSDGSLDPDDAVEASLTFDHDVVGIIYSPERLAESDSLVGMVVDQDAGVSFRNQGLDSVLESDQIVLSDDRRTLDLRLKGDGEHSLDHVRILVALR